MSEPLSDSKETLCKHAGKFTNVGEDDPKKLPESARLEASEKGHRKDSKRTQVSKLRSLDSLDEGDRRKLKNEDSSYDSDFDPTDSVTGFSRGNSLVSRSDSLASRGDSLLSRGDSSVSKDHIHEEISRTCSETLGAEYEEYVTHKSHKPPGYPGTQFPYGGTSMGVAKKISLTRTVGSKFQPTTSLPSKYFSSNPESGSLGIPGGTLTSVVESEEYPQQVEFGVKLGYSENLVQLALSKLGPNPDKNKLLDELIRLAAGSGINPAAQLDEVSEKLKEIEDVEGPILRPIVIDGSNVAMSHGNKSKFSCKGIRLCVEWFRARGHKEIIAFVPSWRKEQSRSDSPILNQEILQELEKEGFLSFTPSRSCAGKRIVPYDDRYIIKEAAKSAGVVVSNDSYRDLLNECSDFRKVIEASLLMYSWINGRFEPPDDPLGRKGPSLDLFLTTGYLRVPQGVSVFSKDAKPCPYGKKCTYGNKCKFIHAERGINPMKSVTEMLHEQKQRHDKAKNKAKSRESSPGENLRAKSLSLPVSSGHVDEKYPLTRTQSTFPTVSTLPTDESREYSSIEKSAAPFSMSEKSVLGSLDSICEPIMKGEPSLFNLCPRTYSANISWSDSQEIHATKSQPLSYSMGLNQDANVSWSDSQEVHATKSQPLSYSIGVNQDGLMDKLHPKLQRQLSLNPVYDERLNKMSRRQNENNPVSQSEQFYLRNQFLRPSGALHPQLHSQFSPQARYLLESDMSSKLGQGLGNPGLPQGPQITQRMGGGDMLTTYFHTPITRHSSSQENKMHVSQILSPGFHNPVGRNLSAPEKLRIEQQNQSGLLPRVTRLNSTSDSSLNIIGNNDPQQFASDPFDPEASNLQYSYSNLGNVNPPPIGTRPLSPQHPQLISQATSMHLKSSATSNEDERLKIFYHLSQLFPEAQVRAALSQNPEETNPTKICMSILSLSSLRPPSPQQSSNIQMSGLGSNMSQVSSLLSNLGTNMPPPFDPFSSRQLMPPSLGPSSNQAQHEDSVRERARREAYSILSKIFPSELVHNVLMMYPDETDSTKLCLHIMAMVQCSQPHMP